MPRMTLGDLKAAILASGLPDDAPVFASHGLDPLAKAEVAWFALEPGVSCAEANDQVDAERICRRTRELYRSMRPEPIRALILISSEDCFDGDEDEDDGGHEPHG